MGIETDCVYFLQRPDGAIKIGWSTNFDRRWVELGEDLVLLATHTGGRPLEKLLHSFFHLSRIEHTEWFTPDIELLQFIKEITTERPMTRREKQIQSIREESQKCQDSILDLWRRRGMIADHLKNGGF